MATDPMTILVIPDSHAESDQDLTRYTLLGRMICDVMSKAKGPCVVVNIGDWFDLPSLNSYDRPGSKSFEGRRYRDDIAAGIEAQRLLCFLRFCCKRLLAAPEVLPPRREPCTARSAEPCARAAARRERRAVGTRAPGLM